jgi:energy-coupling factor transporter ATP-binding protein EcfA2
VEDIKVAIPEFGEDIGISPIVILGPNGSGKTKLAQRIAQDSRIITVSAQRRTWVDDQLPVQEENNLLSNTKSSIDQWKTNPWRPTEEINYVLSNLVQDHIGTLTKRNEEALAKNERLEPIRDTKMLRLQEIWSRLFPTRKLEVDGFFPRVKRIDTSDSNPIYSLREMSDGERTVLYMAARIMTSDQPIILVDEPELHMHSRLAVQFWDEAEGLRPDCRFIYITHDLNFALSRRSENVYIVRSPGEVEQVSISDLPSSIATEVLGAATLPFYAKRIFFYEGESGAGFANEFFSAWFNDKETFAIPCGNRDSVCASVVGAKRIGVAGAEVIGLIDRDFYPDSILDSNPEGVNVLELHELESVLCDQQIVSCLAQHLGQESTVVWSAFTDKIRREYQGKEKSNVVAKRVRARVGDLLDGAFVSAQIGTSIDETRENHKSALANLDLLSKVDAFFAEETKRVDNALAGDGAEILVVLPGKHLLSILSKALGLSTSSQLTDLVIKAIDSKVADGGDTLSRLGQDLEVALNRYLPKRQV